MGNSYQYRFFKKGGLLAQIYHKLRTTIQPRKPPHLPSISHPDSLSLKKTSHKISFPEIPAASTTNFLSKSDPITIRSCQQEFVFFFFFFNMHIHYSWRLCLKQANVLSVGVHTIPAEDPASIWHFFLSKESIVGQKLKLYFNKKEAECILS